MPITLKELSDSRPLNVGPNGARVVLNFVGGRTDDEVEVYAAALSTAPEYFDGFVRQDIDCKPLGGGMWKVDVSYGPFGAGGSDVPVGASGLGGSAPPNPTGPDSTTPLLGGWSFETGGGTTHVTQSILTRESFGPNNQQAIGLTKDGVEGCDVFSPETTFTRTVQRPVVTMAYYKTLRSITGKLNFAPFYTLEEESVLYMGASGSYSHSEGWSITHKFGYSPPQVNVNIGNGLVVGYLGGWDHLWVRYQDQVVGNVLLPIPVNYYVEVVYNLADFSLLEIGT